MSRLWPLTLPALLLLAAPAAFADCHWAWHCDKSAGCGFVPFCDSPSDKPPPFQGARLARDAKPLPLPTESHPGRKPLPGFKPINPAPPGLAPPSDRTNVPPESAPQPSQQSSR